MSLKCQAEDVEMKIASLDFDVTANCFAFDRKRAFIGSRNCAYFEHAQSCFSGNKRHQLIVEIAESQTDFPICMHALQVARRRDAMEERSRTRDDDSLAIFLIPKTRTKNFEAKSKRYQSLDREHGVSGRSQGVVLSLVRKPKCFGIFRCRPRSG